MKPNDLPLHTSTIAASRIILGGIETQSFWGFDLFDFALELEQGLRQYVADPCRLELGPIQFPQHLRRTLDATPDPASCFTRDQVTQLANATKVVGLHGSIGAGKDTLADHLVSARGYTKMSFADPLRAAASVLYGIPLNHFNDRVLKETPLPGFVTPDGITMSPRKCLQLIGTEVCRAINPELWIDRLRLRIAALARAAAPAGTPGVVISDVRFENEAQLVRSLTGGQIVRIHRPAAAALSVVHGARHSSEAGISHAPDDVRLVNDKAVAEFLAQGELSLGIATADAHGHQTEMAVGARRSGRRPGP